VGACACTHTQTALVLDVSPGVGRTPGEPEEFRSTKAQYTPRPTATKPGAQYVHSMAVDAEYVPAAQLRHALAAVSELACCPASQGTQTDGWIAPLWAEAVPVAQATHVRPYMCTQYICLYMCWAVGFDDLD